MIIKEFNEKVNGFSSDRKFIETAIGEEFSSGGTYIFMPLEIVKLMAKYCEEDNTKDFDFYKGGIKTYKSKNEYYVYELHTDKRVIVILDEVHKIEEIDLDESEKDEMFSRGREE